MLSKDGFLNVYLYISAGMFFNAILITILQSSQLQQTFTTRSQKFLVLNFKQILVKTQNIVCT